MFHFSLCLLLQSCVLISENGCFSSRTKHTTEGFSPTTPVNVNTIQDTEQPTTEKNFAIDDENSTVNNTKVDNITTTVKYPKTTEGKVTEYNTSITTEDVNNLPTTTQKEVCFPGVFGNVKHPDLCNSFYLCAGGLPIQLFCRNGFEFDPETQQCVLISDNGCTANQERGTTDDSESVKEQNRSTIAHVPKENDTTVQAKTTVESAEALCLPGQFENVPHPDLCDVFYMCSGGTPIKLYCSNGFEFDPATKRCELIADDGCMATRS